MSLELQGVVWTIRDAHVTMETCRRIPLMVAQPNAAIARLRELPKAELIAKAARSASSLNSLRRQVAESKVPNALKGSASSIAGGALAGALRARAPEVMGVPSEGAAGLLMLGLGVGIGSPMLIHAGTGCLTVLVADFVQDQLSEPIGSAA